MIFYEDFVKKVQNGEKGKVNIIEKYSLEMKRIIMWLGTGIPILLISFYQFYVGVSKGYKAINLIFGVMFLYVAFKHISTVLKYKVKIDTEKNILFYENTEIQLNDIKSCSLKEVKLGKKGEIVPAVDIVTNEQKQFVIPLLMSGKLDFVLLMKKITGNKFNILK